jgi:hypothetical protein
VKTITGNLEDLLAFLQKLGKMKIHYTLAHNQEDAVSVMVAVPGERWEIDFFLNGDIYVERFKSDGKIYDAKALDDLMRDFSD